MYETQKQRKKTWNGCRILFFLAFSCIGRCAHSGIKCLVIHPVNGGVASAQLSPNPEHVLALLCSSAFPAGSDSTMLAELVHVRDQTSSPVALPRALTASRDCARCEDWVGVFCCTCQWSMVTILSFLWDRAATHSSQRVLYYLSKPHYFFSHIVNTSKPTRL